LSKLSCQLATNQAAIQAHVDKTAARFDAKYKEHVAAIHKLGEGQEELRKHNAELWKEVRKMQDVLATKEESPYRSATQDSKKPADFYSYNATFVRIGTGAEVAKSKLLEVVGQIVAEAKLPETCWALHGGAMADRFTLEMLVQEGDTGTASRRVNKVMDMLWNGGKWRKFHVTRPNGKEEPLFINRDCSISEGICSKAARTLHGILDNEFKDKGGWVLNKKTKRITCNWEKVAVVSWSITEEKPEIAWDEIEAKKIGIPIDKVTALWNDKLAAGRRSRG